MRVKAHKYPSPINPRRLPTRPPSSSLSNSKGVRQKLDALNLYIPETFFAFWP